MVGRPPPPPPTIGAISRIRSTADRPRSTTGWSKRHDQMHLAVGRAAQHDRRRGETRLHAVGDWPAACRRRCHRPPPRRTGRHPARTPTRPGRPRGRCPAGGRRAAVTGRLPAAPRAARRPRARPRPAGRPRSRRCSNGGLRRDRLDPAHALRRAGLTQDHERADLGGRADVRAAAQLARDVRRSRPRAPARRTSRRTASSRRAAGVLLRRSRRCARAGSRRRARFTIASTCRSCAGVSGASWRKSKRSLSGPT